MLTKCEACQGVLSSQAKSCPTCGHPVKANSVGAKTSSALGFIVGSVVLVFAGLTLLGQSMPAVEEQWSENVSGEALGILARNNVTGCGYVQWKRIEAQRYSVRCASDPGQKEGKFYRIDLRTGSLS